MTVVLHNYPIQSVTLLLQRKVHEKLKCQRDWNCRSCVERLSHITLCTWCIACDISLLKILIHWKCNSSQLCILFY